MKVSNWGDLKKVRWWIGRTYVCEACGLTGDLEKDDHRSIGWKVHHEGVEMNCPSCETPNTVYRKKSAFNE